MFGVRRMVHQGVWWPLLSLYRWGDVRGEQAAWPIVFLLAPVRVTVVLVQHK